MKTTGTIGYAAMFEQFHPTDLLKWSKVAEESGFTSVMASDHFHPWTPEQGESAFVWSWLGALGQATNMRFGTEVFRGNGAKHRVRLDVRRLAQLYAGYLPARRLAEHGLIHPESPTALEILERFFPVGDPWVYPTDHF